MTLLEDLKRNFYKDGTNEWHKGKIISSIIVVIALLLFIVYKNMDLKRNALDRAVNRQYTIGLTGKKNHNLKSSQPTVKYYYRIGYQEFSGLEHIDMQFEESVISDGGRYYVEFSSKNPANSKLLLNYPVADSIKFPSGYSFDIIPQNESVQLKD